MYHVPCYHARKRNAFSKEFESVELSDTVFQYFYVVELDFAT